MCIEMKVAKKKITHFFLVVLKKGMPHANEMVFYDFVAANNLIKRKRNAYTMFAILFVFYFFFC